jgi:hypothetical protein
MLSVKITAFKNSSRSPPIFLFSTPWWLSLRHSTLFATSFQPELKGSTREITEVYPHFSPALLLAGLAAQEPPASLFIPQSQNSTSTQPTSPNLYLFHTRHPPSYSSPLPLPLTASRCNFHFCLLHFERLFPQARHVLNVAFRFGHV